jgi:hypothetical protein
VNYQRRFHVGYDGLQDCISCGSNTGIHQGSKHGTTVPVQERGVMSSGQLFPAPPGKIIKRKKLSSAGRNSSRRGDDA